MKNPFGIGSFGVVGKLLHRLAFWKRGVKKTLIVNPEIEGEVVIANDVIEYHSGLLEKNPHHLPAKSQARNPELRKNRFGEPGTTRSLILIECVDGEFMSTIVGSYTSVRKLPRFSATAALSIALETALATVIGKYAYDGMASNSTSPKQIASTEKLMSAFPFPSVAVNIPEAHEISRPVNRTEVVETTDVTKKQISSKGLLGEIENRPAATEANVTTKAASADKQTSLTEVSGSSNEFSQQTPETNDAERIANGNIASPNSRPLSDSKGRLFDKLNPAAGDGDKNNNTFPLARHKSAAHSKRLQESSGTTVIGRTLNSFAKQFSKDLRRLPGQISSIFEQ